MTGTEVALLKPRFPMPAGLAIDAAGWVVLTNALYPNARSAESIVLAVSYCKARGLDIMKKPVNIVPVWDARSNDGRGGYIEQIWPSINETQVTAARSGEWAGMDAPVWGPETTQQFNGSKKKYARRGSGESDSWENVSVTVTFPEWCAVTVYRLKGGQRHAFTEPVYWREAYGRAGGGELPNDMWSKRPHGQLHKVAKAASLRAAFPEEGGFDETEAESAAIPHTSEQAEPPKPKDNWRPPASSTASSQPSDRSDDQHRSGQADAAIGGGAGGDASTASTEAKTQPAQAQGGDAPPESVDSDTGEIGPREVPKDGQEDWIAWGQRFINCVQTSRGEAEIKQWGEKNAATLEAMRKPKEEGGAPAVEARLQAAINKHRNTLGPTVIGAG